MDPYQTHDVYFDFKRSQFHKSLTFRHQNVKDKRIILFMKHLYLKKIVNAFQISIIIASTIITFFESMKPHFFRGRSPDRKTQIISISLSTYIAVITAVFKFLKIDDRKEEIYKMLQIFNEVETLINHKIKQITMIQSSCDDEMTYFNKNHIICSDLEDEHKSDDTDEDSQDENYVLCENNTDLCVKRKDILQKYYGKFDEIFQSYEQEEVEKRILEAKKQFHSMFSYNEIIYYKGKIVESMLLDKVHVGNRTILEAPLEEYRNNYAMIKQYKRQKDMCDVSNEIQEIEQNLHRLSRNSKQMYNEDDLLYGTSWCNNICLYFSNICHFCLVMNLYLSLAIKRSKFRSLKKKQLDKPQQHDDNLKFSCCRCKAFDQMVESKHCQNICCCSNEENENVEVVYFCCDC